MIPNFFNRLPKIAPDELYCTFSWEMQTEAWQQSRRHSHPSARDRAYVGHLCLNGFIGWLAERFDSDRKSIKPYLKNLEGLWEFIDGIPILWGNTRLLLIPHQTIELTELVVPQEWVDIPELVADYYLAVQVNLDNEEEDCWMRVCGFASHGEMKQKGEYRRSDRSYLLSSEAWHQDLTLLWETGGISPPKNIANLPPMSYTTVKAALSELSPKAFRSSRLRLQLPFTQWGRLMANETWREELYQQRMQPPPLTQWFETQASAVVSELKAMGWQLYGEVFGGSQFAGAFRRRGIGEPKAEVSCVKRIEIEDEAIALIINLMQDAEGSIAILPQLRPFNASDRTACLSAGIALALLDATGQILTQVESEPKTNLLQFTQPFSNSPGTQFQIRISKGNSSQTVWFSI